MLCRIPTLDFGSKRGKHDWNKQTETLNTDTWDGLEHLQSQ